VLRPTLLTLCTLACAGCPDGSTRQLWLTIDKSEVNVQLTDVEPEPF